MRSHLRITIARRALVPIVSLIAAVVTAQTTPDFSGSWVVVPEQSIWVDNQTGRRVNLRFFGERFTAEQGSNELTILVENDPCPKRYRFDGQPYEPQCAVPAGEAPTRQIAEWRDGRVVVAYPDAEPPPGYRGEVFWTIELSADGAFVVTVPAGHNGERLTAVYRRKQRWPA